MGWIGEGPPEDIELRWEDYKGLLQLVTLSANEDPWKHGKMLKVTTDRDGEVHGTPPNIPLLTFYLWNTFTLLAFISLSLIYFYRLFLLIVFSFFSSSQ